MRKRIAMYSMDEREQNTSPKLEFMITIAVEIASVLS